MTPLDFVDNDALSSARRAASREGGRAAFGAYATALRAYTTSRRRRHAVVGTTPSPVRWTVAPAPTPVVASTSLLLEETLVGVALALACADDGAYEDALAALDGVDAHVRAWRAPEHAALLPLDDAYRASVRDAIVARASMSAGAAALVDGALGDATCSFASATARYTSARRRCPWLLDAATTTNVARALACMSLARALVERDEPLARALAATALSLDGENPSFHAHAALAVGAAPVHVRLVVVADARTRVECRRESGRVRVTCRQREPTFTCDPGARPL